MGFDNITVSYNSTSYWFSGWTYCIYRFLVGKDNLTIMNVTDKDDGTYTCIVNTTLDSVSASAVLTVVGKNTLKLYDSNTVFNFC